MRETIDAASAPIDASDQKVLALADAREVGSDGQAMSARLAQMVEQMMASQRELHEIQHRSRWKRMFRNGVADVARATARIAETQQAMVLFIATLLELQGSSNEMLATMRSEISRIRVDLGLTAGATAAVGADVLSAQRVMDQLLDLVEAAERRRAADAAERRRAAEAEVARPRVSTPPTRRVRRAILIIAVGLIALAAAVAGGLALR